MNLNTILKTSHRSQFFVFFWCIVAIVFLYFPENLSAAASAKHLQQQYTQARFYYTQLENNTSLTSDRKKWLKGVGNFEKIYVANSHSQVAAPCLFTMAKMNSTMYSRFHIESDLNKSIAYYFDLVRHHPQHKLADDAYYALGKIYAEDKDNPEQAAAYLSKVINDYQSSDMYNPAADLLKQLSRDHNIRLPKQLVGNSEIDKLNYVLPVKFWSSNDYSRVVVMLSGPVTYKDSFIDDKSKDGRRRLVIDFLNSYIEPKLRTTVPVHDKLLKSIKTTQDKENTARITFDISSYDTHKIYSLPDPFRVIIDIKGKNSQDKQSQLSKTTPVLPPTQIQISPSEEKQSKNLAQSSNQIAIEKKRQEASSDKLKKISATTSEKIKKFSDKKHSSTTPSLAQQLGLGVHKIVLDAGHGGKDPGAMANGIKEKDIVLKIAKLLRPSLERELGCEVLLTRSEDTFLTLEERTAIANTNNADLFISLHLNAHSSVKSNGFETYYLNLTNNSDSMRVAARENATSTHQMSDLQDILSDILKNTKVDESSRLARQVHDTVQKGFVKSQVGNLRGLGVKQAPFYVLLGAQMPAILIEMAFISNKDDAANLNSQEFIEQLTNQIALGIKSYVNANTADL